MFIIDESNNDRSKSPSKSRETSAKSRKDHGPKDSARTVTTQEILREEENADMEVQNVTGKKEEGEEDGRTESGQKSGGQGAESVQKSGGHGSRSSTPQYLNPPDLDVREERMVLTSDEAMLDLRKRDREALKANLSHKGHRTVRS